MFEVLAVEVDRPDISRELGTRMMEEQSLAASPSSEDGVILLRSDVTNGVANIDVAWQRPATTLDAEVLCNDRAELRQFWIHARDSSETTVYSLPDR
ncbi:MAG TPA: hypothetical protein PKA37_04420 [Planctomycetota bacterium]|nr:hypothetical protein [Planctomycetota bacterium]